MRRAVFLLPLLLGGCSCQPQAERGNEQVAAPAAPVDVSKAAVAESTRVPEAPSSPPPGAVAAGADSEAITVRNYIFALLGSDRATSDAFWTGGRTGSVPDDQVLRTIPKLRNLRVDSDPVIALDTAEPSRLRELPVRVRAVTDNGTLHYHGWYRLQPRPDGSGWEIIGASLQPTLR